MADLNMALDLVKIPDGGVNISQHLAEDRVVTLMVPRCVIKHATGLAVRLNDVILDTDPFHVKDLALYAMVLRTLSDSVLCTTFVERAFLDNSNSEVIVFIILVKHGYKVSDFADKLTGMAFGNACAMGFAAAEERANETADDGGEGAPPQRAKKRLKGGNDANLACLRQAHALIGSTEVPVFRIASFPVFRDSFLSWGRLICGNEEMRDTVVDFLRNRFGEMGRTVQSVAPSAGLGAAPPPVPPPPGGGGNAANGMLSEADATDDEEVVMVAPAPIIVPTVNTNYDFLFEDNSTMTVDVTLAKVLSPRHPVTRLFMRDDLNADVPMIMPHVDVYILQKPMVDLPYLENRFIAPGPIFRKYSLYSEKTRYYDSTTNANAVGDMTVISEFAYEHESMRTESNGLPCARLVFDLMSRPGGRLPKSLSDSMAKLHRHLAANNGYLGMLPRLEDDDAGDAAGPAAPRRVLGTNTPVIRFANLTYSGNYMLYILQNFETSGSFYFHTEQLILMLVLDAVCYRKREGNVPAGMAAHMLNYGPPGVGKSTALQIFIEAYAKTMKTNSYSSARSIYSDLVCSDQMDNKALCHDECPAFIVQSDGGSKTSGVERDLIAQIKEKLTSGNMNGERLVRDENTGTYITKDYNVKMQYAPFIANTNAPEQCGHAPLLDRFISRFYTYGKRAVPHTLQLGKELDADNAMRSRFVNELELHRTLMLLVTKLQSDKVIEPPETSMFRTFYTSFIAELKNNPFLNVEPPSASDRKSSIIELLYSLFVTRIAIHRAFFEPGAEFINDKFCVEQVVELNKYMAIGDMQAAIVAVCSMSHSFRSPTEYACADMVAKSIRTSNAKELADLRGAHARHADAVDDRNTHQNLVQSMRNTHAPADPAMQAAHERLHAAIEHAQHTKSAVDEMAREQISVAAGGVVSFTIDGVQKQLDPNRLDTFPWQFRMVSEVFSNNGEFGKSLMKEYAFLFRMDNLPATLWDQCGRLASSLLESNKGGGSQLLVEHAQKRLHLLATKSIRTGAHAGSKVLRFVESPGRDRAFFVFVSRDWLVESTETHEYGMLHMCERAAKRCSYTSPGTYLVVQPLQLSDVPDTIRVLNNGFEERQDNFIYGLTKYFTVPVHESGCPLRDEAVEANPPRAFSTDRQAHHGCTCFRSSGAGHSHNGQVVHTDPQVTALATLRTRVPNAYSGALGVSELDKAPERCQAFLSAGTYPFDAVKKALSNAAGHVIHAREATAVEHQIATDDYAAPPPLTAAERRARNADALRDLAAVVGVV
jgi:hypothetical protein